MTSFTPLSFLLDHYHLIGYIESMTKTYFAKNILGCTYKHLAAVLSGKAGFGEEKARIMARETDSEILWWIWGGKTIALAESLSKERKKLIEAVL
jgi:arginine repressor